MWLSSSDSAILLVMCVQAFEAEAEAQAQQQQAKQQSDQGKPPPQPNQGEGQQGEQGEPSEGGDQVRHACINSKSLWQTFQATHTL